MLREPVGTLLTVIEHRPRDYTLNMLRGTAKNGHTIRTSPGTTDDSVPFDPCSYTVYFFCHSVSVLIRHKPREAFLSSLLESMTAGLMPFWSPAGIWDCRN